jgi:hypothetical protein
MAENQASQTDDPNASISDEEMAGSPTPSGQRQSEPTSEEIAANPDIQSAFANVFGTGTATAPEDQGDAEAPPATRRRANPEEEADELDGLDADEADDDVEPDGEAGDDEPGDQQPAESDGDQDGGDQPDEGDESPTLSPLLRHAAKRAGWEDGEIDGLAKSNPELAERTFQRLLSSFNDLSARYGQFGSAPAGGPQQQATPPAAPQQQRRPEAQQQEPYSDLLQELYGGEEGVQQLQEKYGQEMVNDLLKPLLGPVQQMQEQVQAREREAMGREIGQFFRGLPEDGFAELYGKGDEVSTEQFENRQRLAQMADQIRYGAAAQGIDLSVGECLDRANMMFASEHMSRLERQKLSAQVKKRSSSVTNRPSQRRRSAGGQSGKPSDEAARDAYKAKAAELGLDVGSG